MKNFVQSGDFITAPAPSAVKAGDGVQVGSLFGVANADADLGADVVLSTRGVYALPKASAQAWSFGAVIYWDAVASKATTAKDDGATPAIAHIMIGHAVDVALNPSATGVVRLSI